MTQEEDQLDPRTERGTAGGWAVTGHISCTSACGELRIPLGVFTLYQEGTAMGNAWVKSTPNALRYEVRRLHNPVIGED